MIPLEEAQNRILATVPRLPTATISLADALGLVTAEDLAATEPIPPFANTGCRRVRRAGGRHGGGHAGVARPPPSGRRTPAGKAPTVPVGSGEAIRIMTGAPAPEGADAIVMVEDTSAEDGGSVVVISKEARPGDHIRPAGGDLNVGDRAFPAGSVLGPAHLGIVASLGQPTVTVVRRPRVAVISTGDELVPPGEPLAVGQIRDSNRPMLMALVAQAGCEAGRLRHRRRRRGGDRRTAREGRRHLRRRRDQRRRVDGRLRHHQDRAPAHRRDELVAGRHPAGQAAGLRDALGGVPIFGLPGNPVSSHVSFELFARPALLQMMGHSRRFRPVTPVVAAHDMRRRVDGKLHLDRVTLRRDESSGQADRRQRGGQASNVLSAMAASDGLALLPDGSGVAAGEPVDVMRLDLPADH